MISEMDNCKSLTVELKNLTDDSSLRAILDKFLQEIDKFNDCLYAFNLATQASQEGYSNLISDYRVYYSSFSGYMQGRETTCLGLIYGYQNVLDNELYPARTKALNEFAKYEKLLLEGKIQIDDALAKISGLQGNLDSLEAKFFIMDRTKNYGAINFNGDAERMASIANVFQIGRAHV